MPVSFRPLVVLSLRQQRDIQHRLSAVEALSVPWQPYSGPRTPRASAVIFI